MAEETAGLTERLRRVEEHINEVERRLPAHSAKPAIMRELFDLENERDALIEQLENQQ